MPAPLIPPDLADMDAMAREALLLIPDPLRGFARDVVVRVDDFPEEDVCVEMGLQSPFDILGLYQGVALDDKDIGASDSQPDMVFLYRRPILDYWAETGEDLKHIVRHILIHEIGHHFGFSDADMEELERQADEAKDFGITPDQRLGQIALLVRDYDEALSYFVDKLAFNLVEDTPLSATKRWVVVSPPGNEGMTILLAKAKNDEEMSRIGNQTGGRVFLFLYTRDFTADFDRLKTSGVEFLEPPHKETYGRVVVFRDLYGNKWDLIERATNSV